MEVSSYEQFLELTGRKSDGPPSAEEAGRVAFRDLEEKLEHKQPRE
jgi:hypothetical protein